MSAATAPPPLPSHPQLSDVERLELRLRRVRAAFDDGVTKSASKIADPTALDDSDTSVAAAVAAVAHSLNGLLRGLTEIVDGLIADDFGSLE